MAGVAGLEPVTSAVTGQRSNQLSYTPEGGSFEISESSPLRQRPSERKTVRAADAKEVGVGNPAEETCRYPNQILHHFRTLPRFVNGQSNGKIEHEL